MRLYATVGIILAVVLSCSWPSVAGELSRPKRVKTGAIENSSRNSKSRIPVGIGTPVGGLHRVQNRPSMGQQHMGTSHIGSGNTRTLKGTVYGNAIFPANIAIP